MENVVLMLLPIFIRQLSCNLFQLVGKTFFAGDFILPFQRRRNRVLMLWAILPKVRTAGIVPASRVGNIKYVPDSRLVAGGVDERDPPAAAPDIPAHFVVPDLITGTGRCVGPLGENHELFVIRILVEPRVGFQKICPTFMAGGDLRRCVVGHLCQSLHITWHSETPPFGVVDKKRTARRLLLCDRKL
ncbi:hypothetical protein [Caproicibacter fermentans]|uniref:hypothetical protein n=1 Tax=Caproicibacter fermentans TaxID=2576756 RepID=UPI001E476E7A|nr:hypothetical protein [Caproicibacter fermentans]